MDGSSNAGAVVAKLTGKHKSVRNSHASRALSLQRALASGLVSICLSQAAVGHNNSAISARTAPSLDNLWTEATSRLG